MGKIHHRLAPLLLAALTVLGPAACERFEPPPVADDPFRVVSLSPALTQMVVDLGAGDLLVAVAENDAAAPAGLPTVGNFLNVDSEALLAVRPTHVLMMTGKDGVPAHLAELARTNGFRLSSYSFPQKILEVGSILCGSDSSVAMVLQRPLDGLQLREAGLYEKLGRVDQIVGDRAPRPRVLMVINLNPLTVSGSDTVLNDVLLFMLHADNAAGGLSGSAPVLDRELLLKAMPDVILLLAPGEPPLGPLDEDPRLAIFRDLDVAAVRNRRIELIDDPLALLPSTSLARVGLRMAMAIHPEAPAEIRQLLGEPAGQKPD